MVKFNQDHFQAILIEHFSFFGQLSYHHHLPLLVTQHGNFQNILKWPKNLLAIFFFLNWRKTACFLGDSLLV